MIIRRNTKEYKTIRNAVQRLESKSSRRKRIKLYLVKPGQRLKDRILLGGKQDPEGLFFDLNYTKLIESFEDRERTLHKSEEENNFYFFTSVRQKDFPETIFEIDPKTLRDLETELSAKINPPAKGSESINIKKDKDKKREQTIKKEAAAREKDLRRLQKKFRTKRLIGFTELDKIWFPKSSLKKGDILSYYSDSRIEESIKYFAMGRLHSLKLGEEQFYHSLERVPIQIKNKLPDWLSKKQIYAKSYNEMREYLFCKDYDHLLVMIEAGCKEIHPWLSRYDNPDRPDYMVINLNPYNATFHEVIEVGQVALEVLKNLKLPNYIKLSDKIGFHFYIPLNGRQDFEKAKELTSLITRLIHLNIPQITTLDLRTAKKDKKVYLENSQHQKTGTIIAPYSIIDKGSTALVAAPLNSDEIKPGLSPEDFTPSKVLKRINEQGNLFSDFTKNEIDTANVWERLNDFLKGKRNDY